MRAVREKLRSRRGLTLTELLVAMLILSLVTVGVATGISASLRVYRQATETSDAQMLTSTLSTALMDELRYARDVSGTDDPTFTSGTFGENVSVEVLDGLVTVGGEKLLGSTACRPPGQNSGRDLCRRCIPCGPDHRDRGPGYQNGVLRGQSAECRARHIMRGFYWTFIWRTGMIDAGVRSRVL